MKYVNADISDLFFNTGHDYNPLFGRYDYIEDEAKSFLESLARLGVDCPTVDELVTDFKNRL